MSKTIKPPFMRTPYNYDMDEASEATGLSCPDKSLAQQEFKEESDINYIAERYGLTGEMPQVLDLPQYGDFTGIFDFQTAQNAVVEAKQQFMTLPAKMRARFNNSPQALLEFLADEDNRKEAEFLGLVKPPHDAPESPLDAPAPKTEGKTPIDPSPKAPEPSSNKTKN